MVIGLVQSLESYRVGSIFGKLMVCVHMISNNYNVSLFWIALLKNVLYMSKSISNFFFKYFVQYVQETNGPSRLPPKLPHNHHFSFFADHCYFCLLSSMNPQLNLTCHPPPSIATGHRSPYIPLFTISYYIHSLILKCKITNNVNLRY